MKLPTRILLFIVLAVGMVVYYITFQPPTKKDEANQRTVLSPLFGEPIRVGPNARGYLSNMDTDPTGFGAYTYVVVNETLQADEDEPSEETRQLDDRYKRVIQTVEETDQATATVLPDQYEYNLFLIPSTNTTTQERSSLVALSRRIRSGIARGTTDPELRARMTQRPGPFLVTTLTPIGVRRDGAMDVLVADLSDTPPQMILEIVRTYKDWSIPKTLQGMERFQAFRQALIDNVLLDENDLFLARTVNGEWLPNPS